MTFSSYTKTWKGASHAIHHLTTLCATYFNGNLVKLITVTWNGTGKIRKLNIFDKFIWGPSYSPPLVWVLLWSETGLQQSVDTGPSGQHRPRLRPTDKIWPMRGLQHADSDQWETGIVQPRRALWVYQCNCLCLSRLRPHTRWWEGLGQPLPPASQPQQQSSATTESQQQQSPVNEGQHQPRAQQWQQHSDTGVWGITWGVNFLDHYNKVWKEEKKFDNQRTVWAGVGLASGSARPSLFMTVYTQHNITQDHHSCGNIATLYHRPQQGGDNLWQKTISSGS